ncbi:isoprenoid synthase domain-containing protein [Mycena floridula]|nr:isoprenoid synthase domain-containing protein [Mycena floridula]
MRWPFHRAQVLFPTSTRQVSSLREKVATKSHIDPFALVSDELSQIRTGLVQMLGSAHPGLDQVAKYYFLRPSKHLRPLLILLFSQATNGLGKNWAQKQWSSEREGPGGRFEELDRPLTRPDVLNDYNPNLPDKTAFFDPKFSFHSPRPYVEPLVPPISTVSPCLVRPPTILPTQMRLAQIVEMIHAASLLHDDVIDESPLRRGVASAPVAFGSKLSILGGNFVLGRASAALARLADAEVVELISSVIANLVEGEILQMKEIYASSSDSVKNPWALYMQKTYMKTASLMAKGARGAVALGGCAEGEIYREIAYAYGRNLGLAFQLIDDALDYEASDAALGKPGGADLKLGLATGPALYAWEEHPELGALIERKFEKTGDVEMARECVRKSAGVERTRTLALAYAKQARDVLESLPDSDAKIALQTLTERVVSRKS